ncbi:hypothetical protein ACPTI3_14310, partial [Enterococcus faecium]
SRPFWGDKEPFIFLGVEIYVFVKLYPVVVVGFCIKKVFFVPGILPWYNNLINLIVRWII